MATNKLATWSNVPVNSAGGAASTVFSAVLLTAANDTAGVSANNVLVATASALEGAYIDGFMIKALGTNVATKIRLFLNNGSDPTVATNNMYLDDLPLAATTISTTAQDGPTTFWPFRKAIQKGFRIYMGLTVTVAAGYDVTPFYGDY